MSNLKFMLPLLAVAMLCANADAGTKRLYRWVDEQGNVHYSDQVPADQARPGKSVLNEQGMTVDHIDAAKTAEQIAAEQRQRQLDQERRRKEQEQAAYDRVLLNTFQSEADIVHARDSKISAIENMIHISQGSLEQFEQKKQALVQRAADAERAGRKVPSEVSDDIADVQRKIANTNQYIANKRDEQAQIRKQYEQDIQRYRVIKAEMSER